jgi:hypothetical protein
MRGFEWSISLSDMSEDVREAIYFVPEAIYAYYKCPRCGSVDYFWMYTGTPGNFISPIIFYFQCTRASNGTWSWVSPTEIGLYYQAILLPPL